MYLNVTDVTGVEIGGIVNPITKDNMDEAKHSLRLLL